MRAVLLALAACSSHASIETCDQDLTGVWIAPDDTRWMLVDHHGALEGYPLFDDVGRPPDGIVVAPRVIDLARTGTEVRGHIARRFMRRGDTCDARAAIRVIACRADALELELTDPPAPLDFGPCRWPSQPDAQIAHWRRD